MTIDRTALEGTARAMVAKGRGILAADESNATMTKRLEAVRVESTPESRRAFCDGRPTPGASPPTRTRSGLCQEAGIVPIVEPEVLMHGDHSIDRSEDVTTAVLRAVFEQLAEQCVLLEGAVLKPNMVLSGYDRPEQAGAEEVAERTLTCLRRVVPAAVPGIAFLSGGQSDERAAAHLNAMNRIGGVPSELTFSYGRALVAAPLKAWAADTSTPTRAQTAFLHRARCNSAARIGAYAESMAHTQLVA